MWSFVIGTWIGAVVLGLATGNHDYGGPFGCTFLAMAITYGWVTV